MTSKGKTTSNSLRKLFRRAELQLGLLTTSDAFLAGVSKDRLSRLVANGTIARTHRGVYRLRAMPESPEQRALAACLACGDRAVASHRTAGALWGIVGEQPELTLTMPRGRRSDRTGFTVHRSSHLTRRDVTSLGRVPITRIERTLFDLASCLDPLKLERALDEALRRKLVSPDSLLAFGARLPPNRKGSGTLMRLVRDRCGRGVPGSELEGAALRLFRRGGLPEPHRQFRVDVDGHTHYVDLAYPDQRVAVELEGRAPHWGRERWQRDHDRHFRLERAGWRPVYFTWEDLAERPLKVLLHLGEALTLWPSRWAPAPRKRAG